MPDETSFEMPGSFKRADFSERIFEMK